MPVGPKTQSTSIERINSPKLGPKQMPVVAQKLNQPIAINRIKTMACMSLTWLVLLFLMDVTDLWILPGNTIFVVLRAEKEGCV